MCYDEVELLTTCHLYQRNLFVICFFLKQQNSCNVMMSSIPFVYITLVVLCVVVTTFTSTVTVVINDYNTIVFVRYINFNR